MSSIPPRDNRVLLTVDALKEDVISGRLAGMLPGERELALRLRISRITLRKALKLLEDEKWVTVSKPGCRREVLQSRRGKHAQGMAVEGSVDSSRIEGKTVVTLAPVMLAQMPPKEILDHTRLNSYCARAGMTLLHRALDLSHLKRPAHRLQEFIKQNPADLYLLQLTTQQTQKWFYDHRIPCIVLGSTWAGCDLPSVDMDQHALGVHAAQMLTRMGHRKVGMLYPDPVKSGMVSFVENLKKAAPDMDLRLSTEDDSPESVLKALRCLVQDPANLPSVIILPRIGYASLATGLFPSLGLKVPEQVSLLCLVHDEVLQYLYPPVAGYGVPVDAYPKTIFNLAVKMLRHPNTRSMENALIVPDFMAAASLVKMAP